MNKYDFAMSLCCENISEYQTSSLDFDAIKYKIIYHTFEYIMNKFDADKIKNEHLSFEQQLKNDYDDEYLFYEGEIKTKIELLKKFENDTFEYMCNLLHFCCSNSDFMDALIYHEIAGIFPLCFNKCRFSVGNSKDIIDLLTKIKETIKSNDNGLFIEIYVNQSIYKSVFEIFKQSVETNQIVDLI